MEDLPGTYIEIDQATYAKNSYHVRVINGKLTHIDYAKVYSKLQPSNEGTPCHTNDVTIVVSSGPNIKWKNITYEN